MPKLTTTTKGAQLSCRVIQMQPRQTVSKERLLSLAKSRRDLDAAHANLLSLEALYLQQATEVADLLLSGAEIE